LILSYIGVATDITSHWFFHIWVS